MNSAFGSIAAVVAFSWMCSLDAGANEAGTAGAPERAFLFSYFIGNGEDGLHLAWSRDGYHWERLNDGRSYLRPEVGESKLMRDPCLLRGPDGTFHLVWTTAWKGKTIGYAASRDLIHWSAQKAIPVMAHEPAALNCWAPEIVWDTQRREFSIFWATTVTNRFRETAGAGDEQYNHRIYATTTTDFTSFTPARLFYDPGFNVIDATILSAGGRYYLIVKDETRNPVKKHLRVASSDNIGGPYGNLSAPFTRDWVEGPTALRVGDSFVVYFDAYRDRRYEAMRSRDLKVWEDVTDRISMPQDARHGTAIEVPSSVIDRLLGTPGRANAADRIDRHALVARHQPVLRQFDPENPLSVGNGEFAFTADVTGLQTFAEAFTNTIPLGTLSQWGWHSFPNPAGWSLERFSFKEFDSHGRKVGYADVPHNERTPEINWLRGNPHRLHLGRIGLVLTKADGSAAQPGDLAAIEQKLDLWEGVLRSRFELEGQEVWVQTVCHPELDLLAVRVVSPLFKLGRLAIQLHFPYGTGATMTADWSRPEAHATELARPGTNTAVFTRRLDEDRYYAAAAWSSNAVLTELARHQYLVGPTRPGPAAGDALELVCRFSPTPPLSEFPGFDQTRAASREYWQRFWSTGGAIDLSASKDPRWRELERRIVLSQYLTAIQCAGSLPPQETGLTYNSWEGKFHLEMHWWHAAHFALWERLPLLERSLGYYQRILPRARTTAKRQGYAGARWPKMTGPTGEDSPSPVGPFLIWQQPHPIFYAELCYRTHRDRATLEKFQDVVSETAEFMSSYAAWDAASGRYVLGPPLQCAQEIFPKDRTMNPTFELTYWRWGLETAQRWRQRLGRQRVEKWDHVLQHLARPPVAADKYLFAETAPDTYSRNTWVKDHPAVTAALGLLPGPYIERETMRRTLHWIGDNWDWPNTWGWDYPMVAMCAARLGEPERAVDALLLDTPKNKYRLNGHNHQRPGLTIYLPGNGGLLYAAAMMAAGWDGAPQQPAPGFPGNGQWTVRWEGLRPAP